MDCIEKLKNMSLLYVDDSDFALKTGKNLFSKYFKNVDIASSAKEAFEKLKNKKYDIVITDIVMPEISGFDLAKEIKIHYPEIIVLFLSSFFDTNTLLKAIEIGVDGFLIKPFDEKIFLEIFNNILKYKCELKEHQSLLNQYRDIVDENLIVSKTDLNGKIIYVNEAFEKISGFKKNELIGKSHNIIRHPDMKKEVFSNLWETIKKGNTWKGVIKNRKKNGETYYVDTVIKPIFDSNGKIKEFIALRKDITKFMSAEKLINDKLRLINDAMLILVKITNLKEMKLVYEERIIFKYKIRLIKMIKRYFYRYFKKIEEYDVNDDTFGLLISDYKPEKIKQKCEEIIKKLINRVIIVKGFEFYPLVKMSVAYGNKHIYTNAMLGLEELEKNEDLVIIANGLCAEKKSEVLKNMEMLKIVENSLSNNGIISYFQPIFNNNSGKIVKFEALVRIKTDDGKILTPFFFLEVAKKAGLYGKITLKMIEHCFEVYKKYKIPISINLSPSDILRDFIRKKVIALLKNSNIKKGDITFELLEDEIIKFPHLLREFFNEVISLNGSIAIDDFGSGYSNFERIIEAKAEIVKLDGSLIMGIEKDITKQHIVESIVHFAKKENIKVVAEFVENKEILETIKKLGVDCSQGYYYSPPIPPEDIGKFL
ncbi:EAL domain-containing response regulator [Caminibacter sp.]